MNIPYLDLFREHEQFQDELNKAISKTIQESKFINGPAVKEFASALSNFMEGLYVIPCGNGTDALQLALMALDLKPGDKIAVPTFTYIASAEVIALLNLEPVLVDVTVDTFNIDLEDLERKLKENDIKVVIPVHLYGQSADMEAILDLKQKFGFSIVEDNAQALGSSVSIEGRKQLAGSLGDFSTTSFFPTKVLGCMGDGGAIFTKDTERYEYCRMLANHGQSKKYYHDFVGVNSRLDTMQAAILSLKLGRLSENLQKRRELASVFDQAFDSISWLFPPVVSKGNSHVYHQYTLRVINGQRDDLQLFLKKKGIPTTVYYPVPIHLQKGYQRFKYHEGDFPIAEKLSKEVLSIPIFPGMTNEEQAYIIESIKQFKA